MLKRFFRGKAGGFRETHVTLSTCNHLSKIEFRNGPLSGEVSIYNLTTFYSLGFTLALVFIYLAIWGKL